MIDKLGIQTFTIRKLIENPNDLYDTLLKLHNKGISSFELARISFSEEEIQVLRKLKEDKGICYTAIQVKLEKIEKNLDWYATFCKTLGITYIEVSAIPILSFLNKEKGFLNLAKRLNLLGEKVRNKGVQLIYHHHHYELIRIGNLVGLDQLIKETEPKYVQFLADTYWLARGGYNPASFIEKNKTRIKGVHLRDFELKFSFGRFVPTEVAVGDGRIDFKEILSKKNDWDIDFYSIEQDTKQPLEDLLKSYQYLKKMVLVKQ